VDELESGFIENEEISSTEERGIMCEGGQQSMVIMDEEHKPLISQEENVKVDEVLVLMDETENTEETVNGNPAPEKVETGHSSEHEDISARLEPSIVEKYMGLMMEQESTKRQVVTLQKLLTKKEEEYRVKLADLASKMVCFRCGETMMKKDEAAIRRSSIISFGRTTQEVSQSSPNFHSTPNPSPSSGHILSRTSGVAALGASFFTVPPVDEDQRTKL